MARRWVRLEAIYIGDRLRAANPEKVTAIAKSIKEVGLINPPAVRIVDNLIVDGEECDGVPVLVIGLHRVEALKSLGEDAVECEVYDVDENDATILEADENLARADLTIAERRLFTAARERAWLAKQGKKEAGDKDGNGGNTVRNSDSIQPKRERGQPKKFATETADSTGQSRTVIYDDLKAAKSLGEDTLKKIVGTSLDSYVEQKALMSLPEDKRAEVVERAAAGEKVSARPPRPPRIPTSTPPHPDDEPPAEKVSGFREGQAKDDPLTYDESKAEYFALTARFHRWHPIVQQMLVDWVGKVDLVKLTS